MHDLVGVPVVLDRGVALTRTVEVIDPGTGEPVATRQVDVLCWRVGSTIVMHPDRWSQLAVNLGRTGDR